VMLVPSMLAQIEKLQAEKAELRRQLEEARGEAQLRASGTSKAIEWLRDETMHTAEGLEVAELVARELDRMYAEIEELRLQLEEYKKAVAEKLHMRMEDVLAQGEAASRKRST
jgi:predicted RNase H-like nuclease (RuvC/YqgF family)